MSGAQVWSSVPRQEGAPPARAASAYELPRADGSVALIALKMEQLERKVEQWRHQNEHLFEQEKRRMEQIGQNIKQLEQKVEQIAHRLDRLESLV